MEKEKLSKSDQEWLKKAKEESDEIKELSKKRSDRKC